jgi:hypothetical protein
MTMMTTRMTKAGDIPRAGETREAAQSVRERAPAPEQTQARRLARRRNSFLQRQGQPMQKNPQA